MTKEEKDKLNEYRKAWYHKLDLEKKNKLKIYYRDKYYALLRLSS